jgi:hypothetical protein|tara:strand:+ start:9520 stop:10467 length:948 start_codon:yes stop_codon:yes gene_type:complete
MATTTSITTTYAGEFAGDYIAAALLEGRTIAAGGITVKPNVKFKEVIKKLATNDIVKDATCDFDATSTLTLTERILQPEEQQVNLQICKKDFVSDWEAIQMGYSAYHNVPPKFADFLIGHVASKVAEKTETSIWRGDTSNNGEFDGLTTKIAVDAALPAAQEVAGTTVTSSNVIAQLGSIADAIPSAVLYKEDLHIYVSTNIFQAYKRALGGFASNVGAAGVRDLGPNQDINIEMFDGIKVFRAPGLADNTAVAAEKSNLFFGTGLLADHNEVKVLDMADLDGSQNARIIMRFTAGVQYGVIEDIVTYGITNSAN